MTSLNIQESNSYFYFDFPEEILEIEGNDKCADCDAPNPTWASKNLGVLICLKCSGKFKFFSNLKFKKVYIETWALIFQNFNQFFLIQNGQKNL